MEKINNTTGEDYAKKIKSLKRLNSSIKFFCNVIIIYSLIVLVSIVWSHFAKKREECHFVTKKEDISVEEYYIEDMIYKFTYKDSYVIDGETYYDITLGDYEITAKASDLKGLVDKDNSDTALKTDVYLLKYTNNKDYFLSSYLNKDVYYVRFTGLSQGAFSQSEKEAYLDHAAKYFTFERYKFYRFAESLNYEEKVKEQVTNSVSSLKVKGK